jgi:CelD/BcsL family acetyltransferase involved in cellulose biosynthesis
MSIAVEVLTAIADVDRDAYLRLQRASAASAFYDPRFLAGVERLPLLPADKTYYLVARDGPRLVGFLPAYLQSPVVVDPFGVLGKTTSARFAPEARGLFSHVMHCYDSTILCDGGPPVLEALLAELGELGRQEGAQHFAIMNVPEGRLLAWARQLHLEVSFMVDRFSMELAGVADFDALVARLPADGRHEMRRQLRKFAASDARAIVETAPFARLEEVAELCHVTTARKGTPQYLPPGPLAALVRSCGDMIRLVSVYVGDRRVAGLICIDDGPVLHLWLGGVMYDGVAFSPYTVGIAEAYRYALAQGKRRIEVGRLNAKIKHRLGLLPQPLYAIVSPDLLTGTRRNAPSASRQPALPR